MVYQGGLSGSKHKKILRAVYMVKLLQNIDTLKYHLYPSTLITNKDIEFYNLLIDKLLSYKSQAQINRNENKNFSEFQHDFKGDLFQIMPSTVRGFSVSVKNQDITIHLKKLTITADQSPFCKVEFRASFLQRYGYMYAVQKINKFLKENIISSYKIKISEIHLHCDIQGYEFGVLDFHRIKSNTRSNAFFQDEISSTSGYYYSSKKFQGFMRGSGDYLMRVYNKTKEIKKFPDKSYIESLWRLNKDYDETKNVFRIEFQIRREKLKNMVIDGSVLDGFEIVLDNLNNLWGRCIEDFSLRDLNDSQASQIMFGHRIDKDNNAIEIPIETIRTWFKRSDVHPLWKLISTFNGHNPTDKIDTFVKPFTKDFIYVHNSFKAFLSTALSHFGDLLPSTIEEAIHKVGEYTLKKHEKTVLEDVYSKRLDRFNKLEIYNPDDEKLYTDKHKFVNRVFDTIERSYYDIHGHGVDLNGYFIDKFAGYLGKAI